ncbi:MAG: DUF488 domain-containing protein [Methylocapsa sp.]|nr:DUF488 domain-containing protein [Methylocapsa sp.]
MKEIRIKRVYEPPARSDGKRILIDRIWPRGMKREDAHVDAWIKDIAPSSALRRWFGHDPEKWAEFRRRYLAELRQNPAVGELQELAQERKTVTLLFGAKDSLHNNAVVLRDFLRG